ncbi:MAG: bifunctional UDP-3-O-[3-hydroxymyristoyl] N-acetylglucosamine deacetylase/3-hydroxyacyl-ACP dehydratase [Opitutales bacterium]|nr:bifunctional UDP-3-O-[3-hydroxymyristoyl] N-acetylglucosamine deacetylase/3-hydroxyacyl-ACP dehydratase [Opitutales bacterium]MCH8540352.1 bifunctional UDP-3-O-[3-hydroxymyristoyl] N-acetylglucosamine deacetylase/3-hydroxyacyl-ACP dehydratase [Opitutales bacterium]
MKQRSLLREASIKGKSLHTGDEVRLTLKPAPANSGLIFRRTDLYGKPEIRPQIELVTDLVRSTTIASGYTKIHTVEHVLSALHGCGIDNAIIEMDASEPPIMDGSAAPFVKLIEEAEPVELDKEREYYEVTEPISVTHGNSSIIALPCDHLKISCTSTDDRGIHTQHLSLDIDAEVYAKELAPARTFTIYEEIEELIKLGKIRGGSLENAVVIKGDKILSKEPLRFKDEFVRHKMLDIVGDVFLLGKPLKAHIIAMRPGHNINSQLTKALFEKMNATAKSAKKTPAPKTAIPWANDKKIDITKILNTLPHRYPFVMIDRVVDFPDDESLVAIKNVTINEPYFTGHFPGRPVMPGVLQVEAMAQASGLLMLRKLDNVAKLAYFMSADKVKFRKAVEPGDQLVIEVKLLKSRGNKIGQASAKAKVDGEVVSSAELMFIIAEAGENA